MSALKITIVLDILDPSGQSLHPVTGRSGTIWGYAQYCPKRGTTCMRMSLEQFREAKKDLFETSRRYYYPVPDVEVEEVPEEVDLEQVFVPESDPDKKLICTGLVAPFPGMPIYEWAKEPSEDGAPEQTEPAEPTEPVPTEPVTPAQEPGTPHTEESLGALAFFALSKIAKDMGIDPAAVRAEHGAGAGPLRKAIMAKQSGQ